MVGKGWGVSPSFNGCNAVFCPTARPKQCRECSGGEGGVQSGGLSCEDASTVQRRGGREDSGLTPISISDGARGSRVGLLWE